MISGLNLQATVDFILPDDNDNPTVWKIGIIASDLLAQIGAQGKDNPIQASIKFLQLGLKGWTNLEGVEYKTEKTTLGGIECDAVPIDLIKRIPLNVVMALSEKVFEINHLTPGERKN